MSARRDVPPCAHPGCTAAGMYAEHPDRLGSPPDWPGGRVRWLCPDHASRRPWRCAHPGCTRIGMWGENCWSRIVPPERLTGPETWWCIEHIPERLLRRHGREACTTPEAPPPPARPAGPVSRGPASPGPIQGRLL